jgi:peptidoglycan hydrolase CwlO-like protein
MKTLAKLLLTLVILGIFSCQQKEKHKEAVVETVMEQEEDFQFPAVSLNAGQLWEANTETTQGIKNMQQLLDSYPKENGNPEELIAGLKAEFGMIFKKCTMTGEAHEQLHNYLIPLKTKIESLSEPISDENTNDLKMYLEDYFNFFH